MPANDAEAKKMRDFILEKISLGNIQKLILKRDPKKNTKAISSKDDKNDDLEYKK